VVIDIFVLVKEFCELLLLLHLFQKSFANYGQFYQRFLQRCFFSLSELSLLLLGENGQ